MATPDYHGPKPVSPADKKMAKQHLDATANLLRMKLGDHQRAKQATSDPKSKAYNQSHIQSHQQDLQGVQKSLNTLSKLKGDTMAFNTKKTGTYKGKSNAAGGGGRFQQMTDSGMSKGLASYIGRKKFGASGMAKMAAAGKKNG